MSPLPAEVFDLILVHLDINDILQLQLCSRELHATVSLITGPVAVAIARNTFPSARLLFSSGEATVAHPHDLNWLLGLIPKFLASVLVDWYRQYSRYRTGKALGFPAEAAEGESLRDQVTRGLTVWSELASIAETIRRARWSAKPNKILAEDVISAEEAEILKARLDYISSLNSDALQHYRVAFSLLLGAFKTNNDAPSWRTISCHRGKKLHGDKFDWDDRRRLGLGNSWMNWYLCEAGPRIFWQQWSGRGGNHAVQDAALEAWNARSPEQISMQRSAAAQLEKELQSGSLLEYGVLDESVVGQWNGEQATDGTWDGVPFIVDFRDDNLASPKRTRRNRRSQSISKEVER